MRSLLIEQVNCLRAQQADRVSADGGASNRNRKAPSRKEKRKAEREQKKKQKRQQRPTQRLNFNGGNGSESDEDEDAFSPEPQPVPQAAPKAKPAKDSNGNPIKSILKTTKKAEPPKKADVESSPPPPPRVSRAVKDRLADDDAEIAALEKKLGMKKGKKSKAVDEDGLDWLLDGLDGSEDEGSGKRKRSEDDEWLKQKRRKVSAATKGDQEESASEDEEGDMLFGDDEGLDGFGSEGSDSEGEEGFDLDGEDISGEDFDEDDEDEDMEEDGVEDEDGTDDDEDGDDGFEDFESDGDEEEAPAPKPRENPYVAPVPAGSAAPAPAGKYVPPSMRGAPKSDEEALQRLRRQIQGQLNRLSEANLISILQSVEQIYQNNPRQYVTTTLIDILLGLICDKTSLMDTFLILHAGFIAALYKVIGTDFGAQVIERIVADFDRFYAQGDSAGKEAANLLSLLAELYNFQVIGCAIMFDYIRVFLQELSENDTELLLKVIRTSGSQLRQDDPSSLKDIVVLVQKSVAKTGEANISVRTKFMIETINNLKNNRMKTGAAASAVASEHTTRMKKTLGSLNTRSIKASEPLRINLADIRDTEKKGKWWLVGASYHDPSKLATSTGAHEPEPTKRSKGSGSAETPITTDEGTADLLQLAREQRMNTDIRRAIFITIMSASDFKDAHIRLLKLRLKKSQELEIPRVLIHCAGAETTYNPYYTLIARKLCGEKKLQKAFQFGLWDLFKRMGENREDEDEMPDEDEEEEMGMRRIVNLARMFADLMAEGGFPVTSLKTLNFAYLQPKTKNFCEVLFTTLFTTTLKGKRDKWENSLQEIISNAQQVPDMVQGLRYFVETTVAKASLANTKKEKEAIKMGVQITIDALMAPAADGMVLDDEDEE